MVRRRAKRPSVPCPLCGDTLEVHFHRNEQADWDICSRDCGWVTCMKDEIYVNLRTREVRRASVFTYNA